MDALVAFWQFAARLKEEERQGWTGSLGLRLVESVADHSFGVALLGLFEAERRGLDVGKVLTLATIHDLEEAITGDLTPSERKRRGVRRVRRVKKVAVEAILSVLPQKLKRRVGRLWRELDSSKSQEARLVHDLDKLEMALQASEYGKRIPKTKLASFYNSATREISDPVLKRIVLELESNG